MPSRKAKNPWVSGDQPPSKDGRYIVHCPSADPDNPLIAVAWWHGDGTGWSLLPPHWLAGIRHWMPVPKPPGRP